MVQWLGDMLVLAALGIDFRYCKTLELVTTELVRLPYDAEVCRSKGTFIKQHQYIRWALIFHKLKLILLLQPVQSTLIGWMLRIMSSTGSNTAWPQVWVSGQVWLDARLSELTRSTTASGIMQRHIWRFSVHYDELHPLQDSGFVLAMYQYG